MPLNPGNDTVTFNFPGVVNDRLHKVVGVSASTFDQSGCFVQPISVNDKVSDTEYSEATDRCLAPYTDDTQTVKAEWFAVFGGRSYRILGAKPHRDNFGRGLHITFVLKVEDG